MPRRIILRGIGVCGLAAFLGGSTACELFQEAGSPTGDIVPPFGVLLRIDNQSGFPAVVDIVFELAGQATRDTRRLLAESGPDAVQDILWTRADRVTVIARVAPDGGASAAVHVGDVLATREYLLNQDYQPGDTIEFIIPSPEPGTEPFPDCNGNGTNDLIDVLAAESADCNGNAVPDECDIASGAAVDSDGNGVPDECERGACCFDDGSCDELVEADCTSQGGAFKGEGTDCAGAACPLPDEACCFDDGSCQDLTSANCLAANGGPRGAGTDCATTSCQVAHQACCFPAGDCSDLTPGECAFWGGQPQGVGSECQGVSCPQPTIACCFPDAICQDLPDAQCASLGGAAQGPGTSCDPNSCPQPAECCVGDVYSDGVLDGKDIASFIELLLNPPAFGTIQFCWANVNDSDWVIDLADVPPFVQRLLDAPPCGLQPMSACCWAAAPARPGQPRKTPQKRLIPQQAARNPAHRTARSSKTRPKTPTSRRSWRRGRLCPRGSRVASLASSKV